MLNNLFVCYDLHAPDKNYEKVTDAIKKLGGWAKVQYSVWYVNSIDTAQQAFDKISNTFDADDSVIVVDATNNNAAWKNLTHEVAEYLKNNWNH